MPAWINGNGINDVYENFYKLVLYIYYYITKKGCPLGMFLINSSGQPF